MNAQKASFLCTSAGAFPGNTNSYSKRIKLSEYEFAEPTNCSQWHQCSDVGSQSIITECPGGKIFDSKLKSCVPRPLNYQRICKKISCDNVKNDFVIFPANPAFYAYCFMSAAGVPHTYMYKCDDEANKVFDIRTKKCRFNCKSTGYYADPSDCSSYYICNGPKYASRYVHCPVNYFFNGTACLNSQAHCPTGSIVTATTAIPVPIVNNSMAADELSHASTISAPVTDEVTDATTLSMSESSITETSTTSESMTMQTDALQMDMSTKRPSGAIWKHMGLISVRVGRFLNLI